MRLRLRDLLFVDLDERVLAEVLDVGLVVALERLFAGVAAEAVLDRLERWHLGREALLDQDHVPRGLRLERAEDRAGGGVEDGFVELGDEVAAIDFAELAALIAG